MARKKELKEQEQDNNKENKNPNPNVIVDYALIKEEK